MSLYAKIIRDHLNRIGRSDVDPRHVEAYMRVGYGTLDHLSREKFAREVAIAVECVDEGGLQEAEDLAQSYGLFVATTRDLMIPKISTSSKIIPFDTEARRALQKDEADLRKVEKILTSLQAGRHEANWTIKGALETRRGLRAAIRAKRSRL